MKSFTEDLIEWIEKNIHTKASLDKVAEKAGYSKWYLQRMFKAETGLNMGLYIRLRKLYKSAVMLKLTGMSVIDITDKMNFSSQQVFTKVFKQHFGVSPARYRKTRGWNFDGLTPRLRNYYPYIPVAEHVLASIDFISFASLTYGCFIDKIDCEKHHLEHRIKLLTQFRSEVDCETPLAIALEYIPNKKNTEITNISVTLLKITKNIETNSSEFLRFAFRGNLQQLTRMQISIYHHILPHRKEIRDEWFDIFIPDDKIKILNNRIIKGHYYIPVKSRSFG